jgi:DNA-binding CsgD family transcriptional regulator
MTQSGLYLVLAPFALFLVSISLVFATVNLRQIKSQWLLPFMVSVTLVIVFTIVELLADDAESLLLASHITYTFLTFVPIGWLLACAEYAQTPVNFKRLGVVAAFLVIPVITIVLAWTNPTFHLLWAANDIERDGQFLFNHVTQYGPWFWIYISYAYTLYLAGTALVFRGFFLQRGTRKPITVVGVTMTAVPLAVNLLYIFRLIPGIHRDFSTLVFAPSALVFVVWASRLSAAAARARETARQDGALEGIMPEEMSRREREVCDLLIGGLTNKEIADKLCISENTAKTHTRHVYRKMGVSNRQELIARFGTAQSVTEEPTVEP